MGAARPLCKSIAFRQAGARVLRRPWMAESGRRGWPALRFAPMIAAQSARARTRLDTGLRLATAGLDLRRLGFGALLGQHRDRRLVPTTGDLVLRARHRIDLLVEDPL